MKARQVRSINPVRHAQRARELASLFIRCSAPIAKTRLEGGEPLAEVSSWLLDTVRRRTSGRLFRHLDMQGVFEARKRVRWSPVDPRVRLSRGELSRKDIPSWLLDVDALVPDLPEMVSLSLQNSESHDK